ncbi:LysR family transcriptional regulator (plasmid) [Paracoccus sp. Arc7-R13]|uniref:LysR substrate-binding domain-containing protein n=1 Tax=Paracoccus sp. Arc7-R13 TaxID=2500532 RepID=UPI000FDCBBDB|nr:LysR substrate-binding domain-containing protein [Paracoccus sp. Arc7-R13]AZY96030.1 LysR family transcriptional regulator [Paracoccus sp. Arc7-R13]
MIAPRRFLPSIQSLLALEAVERVGSVGAAAEDLALTHSAVSRQLRILQDQLGVELFRRKGKGLSLTQSGVDYARSARGCLQDLARASLKLRAAGSQASLNLAIRPTFGMHWLVPRLRDFAQLHPEITVNLSTRLAPFDLASEGFDAAIHFGEKDWTGMAYMPLATERLIPCCHPDLLPQGEGVAGLLSKPLLHLQNRPGAWEEWFERHGLCAVHLRGMLFDQFAAMAEAAALGFGIALLPDHLAERYFTEDRLRPAWPEYTVAKGQYYLVWAPLQTPGRPLALLLDFLRQSR